MGRNFVILFSLSLSLILLPYMAKAIDIAGILNIPATNAENKDVINPLIEKACGNTKHKELCVDTLKAQPGAANADIKTLAFMSLNVTKTYGVTVSDWVAQKLEDNPDDLSPKIEQALTDCNEQYTDAMAQLEDSIVAFFSNGFNDVKTWMMTALKNAETCQASLTAANAEDVMAKRNEAFAKYCSITLGVLDVYSKQQQKH